MTTSIAGLIGSDTNACRATDSKRQTEARHIGQIAGMSRNHDAQFIAINCAFGGVDANHLATFAADVGDFALLDHVHTHVGTGTRVAPCHRIMTGRAAACLP